MNVTRATAGSGWNWIVEGWRLFMKAPGIWLIIILIYLGITIVLEFIPFVGVIAHTLLSPVLVGGMLYGAAMLDRGESLEISHLFQGFKDQDRLGTLVVLGLLGLAGGVLVALVLFLFMGSGLLLGGVLDYSGAIVPSQSMGGVFAGIGLIAFLIVLFIGFLVAAALFYGVPLVMLAGQQAWPAVQDSITACWINFLPLLLFGLIYIVLGILALIPFGLGFLVLGPVTVGAVYASYREIFQGSVRSSVNLAK